jgi:hypothetical protein
MRLPAHGGHSDVTDFSRVSVGFSLESSLFTLQTALAVSTKIVSLRAEWALLRLFLYIHSFSSTESDSTNSLFITTFVCIGFHGLDLLAKCGLNVPLHFYSSSTFQFTIIFTAYFLVMSLGLTWYQAYRCS